MKVRRFIMRSAQEKASKYNFTLAFTEIDKDWCEVPCTASGRESEKAKHFDVDCVTKDGSKRTFGCWFPKSCIKEEPADVGSEIPFN